MTPRLSTIVRRAIARRAIVRGAIGRRAIGLGVIACIAIASALASASLAAVAIAGAGAPRLRGLDGRSLAPFAPTGRAGVLFFVSRDCPMSNGYAQEIQRLCADYAAKGVQCLLVYEDEALDAAGVRTHLAEYRYDRAMPAAIDTNGTVAAHARATITPQAVLVDRGGSIRYRGRIDNRYASFAKPRQQVTEHDLRDALDAVLADRPVARADTEALGCAIAPQSARTPPARITFSDAIAPIVHSQCVTCHRPGEAAPFSLITYDDVKKRAKTIVEVTQSRVMPPWQATHGAGEFVGERRLSHAQIDAFRRWHADGMPKGDLSKVPPPPSFVEGWQLGTPDLILEMPVAYDVPASGPDAYRSFAIPTGLTEDRWVRAVEFRPRARKAVHHALFAYARAGAVAKAEADKADGKPGIGGLAPVTWFPGFAPAGDLGAWTVGATPGFLPDGLARSLPKGTDFVVQLHVHPTGKPETERAQIGLYFTDKQPDRGLFTLATPGLFGLLKGIDIPPGAKDYVLDGTLTMGIDMRIMSVTAHAHYLGKEIKAVATLPDGTERTLLWIPDWDFNWQDQYFYKDPPVLPKGTRIDVRLTYDNSADNPRNPNSPPKRVQWGEESSDEMGSVQFLAVAANPEDEEPYRQQLKAAVQEALKNAVKEGAFKKYQDYRARKKQEAAAQQPSSTPPRTP
jgi:hypothetical protein